MAIQRLIVGILGILFFLIGLTMGEQGMPLCVMGGLWIVVVVWDYFGGLLRVR